MGDDFKPILESALWSEVIRARSDWYGAYKPWLERLVAGDILDSGELLEATKGFQQAVRDASTFNEPLPASTVMIDALVFPTPAVIAGTTIEDLQRKSDAMRGEVAFWAGQAELNLKKLAKAETATAPGEGQASVGSGHSADRDGGDTGRPRPTAAAFDSVAADYIQASLEALKQEGNTTWALTRDRIAKATSQKVSFSISVAGLFGTKEVAGIRVPRHPKTMEVWKKWMRASRARRQEVKDDLGGGTQPDEPAG